MKKNNLSEYGVIIVAGGSGKRFGGDLPKQFLLLHNRPMLMQTIKQFDATYNHIKIVVVLPENHHTTWVNLCKKYNFNIQHKLTTGGKERFLSVKNGLEKIDKCEVIGVHDGVRPLVSTELIKKCYKIAKEKGACVPVIPVSDSLRKGNFQNNQPINRENIYRVQTPQVFNGAILSKAYSQQFSESFTDDASVVERAGYQITLTEGEEENIKVTKKKDILIANALINLAK